VLLAVDPFWVLGKQRTGDQAGERRAVFAGRRLGGSVDRGAHTPQSTTGAGERRMAAWQYGIMGPWVLGVRRPWRHQHGRAKADRPQTCPAVRDEGLGGWCRGGPSRA